MLYLQAILVLRGNYLQFGPKGLSGEFYSMYIPFMLISLSNVFCLVFGFTYSDIFCLIFAVFVEFNIDSNTKFNWVLFDNTLFILHFYDQLTKVLFLVQKIQLIFNIFVDMGNSQTGKKSALFKKNSYPFLLTLVPINLQVQYEGINFQSSPYNIQKDKFSVTPVMDKEIRNSEFCYVPVPRLSQTSQQIIKKYLQSLENINDEYDQLNHNWRMTKYHENGHFVQHMDRQKFMAGYRHFGTQIFLPPYSELKYEGGQLKVVQDGKQFQILPHEKEWTHIILPLGVQHQVKKVTNGLRVSYVKQIWLKQNEEPIETDQERQVRIGFGRRRGRMGVVD